MDFFVLTKRKRKAALAEEANKTKIPKNSKGVYILFTAIDLESNTKICQLRGIANIGLKEKMDAFFAGKIGIAPQQAIDAWAKRERELIFGTSENVPKL